MAFSDVYGDKYTLSAKFVSNLIECEVAGQLEHYLTTGEYVKDQRRFCSDYMKLKPTIH